MLAHYSVTYLGLTIMRRYFHLDKVLYLQLNIIACISFLNKFVCKGFQNFLIKLT